MNHSNPEFITIYDSDSSDDLEFVSICYSNDESVSNISYRKFHLPMELIEPETDKPITAFVQKLTPVRKRENEIEGSILKSSKKPAPKSAKKVVFISPKIIDIPAIDARIRRSVHNEIHAKSPVTPILKSRPKSLSYSEGKKKISQLNSSKIPVVKRLVSPPKAIENPQSRAKKGNNSCSVNIKGVRMNKRFELQMKNLLMKKKM
ncbi:hypothetical protein PVAND_016617 [Polypedilum vanderplanki]|uniref:Uncharacterized protein n=1 Tax=Polypedilum vanderplanki TaxID=319348 RepID=A0A9J6BGB1_POLVA|nr:hypothetical protein PVAND_016617 [Polypedilum vanderplanki]